MKQHKIGLGFAFAVALGVAAPALGQQAVQWRVEDGGNGHWYGLVNLSAPSTWAQARAYALSLGGDLVSITSADLQALVVPLLGAAIVPNGAGGVWIGAYQLPGDPEPGGFRWVNGAPFAYTGPGWVPSNCCSSCPGESGENYVTIASQIDSMTYHGGAGVIGWWNDVGCIGAQAAVFEWSADCNGDEIVDYRQCRDGSLPDYDGDNVPDCCEAGTPCVVGNYPVQWRVEDGGNGHWYRRLSFGSPDRSFSNARDVAAAAGGMLATPLSEAENNFVRDLNRFQYRSYWLGGVQIDPACSGIGCAWRWITEEVWEYTNWCCGGIDDDVGNEDCLASSEDGSWNSVPCVGGLGLEHFMVEWSADCNGDGIVDYGQILQGQLADTDSNGVPDLCEVDPCPGDVTDNGVVDGVDLSLILALWGTSGQKFPRSDANGDGTVDASDLAIVLSGWGDCP